MVKQAVYLWYRIVVMHLPAKWSCTWNWSKAYLEIYSSNAEETSSCYLIIACAPPLADVACTLICHNCGCLDDTRLDLQQACWETWYTLASGTLYNWQLLQRACLASHVSSFPLANLATDKPQVNPMQCHKLWILVVYTIPFVKQLKCPHEYCH